MQNKANETIHEIPVPIPTLHKFPRHSHTFSGTPKFLNKFAASVFGETISLICFLVKPHISELLSEQLFTTHRIPVNESYSYVYCIQSVCFWKIRTFLAPDKFTTAFCTWWAVKLDIAIWITPCTNVDWAKQLKHLSDWAK